MPYESLRWIPPVQEKQISDRRVIRARRHATPNASDVPYAAKVTCLADIAAEDVKWLWRDVVPMGKVTSLTGDVGVGKTLLALEIAADVTRGRRTIGDGDDEDPGDVLLVSSDHGLADVIAPRLKQAGADLARVNALRGVCRRNPKPEDQTCWLFELDEDLRLLELEIGRQKTEGLPLRLIVIDPFPLHLFEGGEAARELLPTIKHLAEIAAWSETAILLVASRSNPHRRSGIMRDLEVAAHSAWTIEQDFDVPDRRLLLPVKTSLRELSSGLAFRFQNNELAWESAPFPLTAQQFQAESRERSRNPLFKLEWSELARARDWLQRRLKSEAVPMRIIKQDAAANHISYGTLCRAFCGLRGISRRIEGTRSWEWALPASDVIPASVPQWCVVDEDDAA